MLDPQLLRDKMDSVATLLKQRGFNFDATLFKKLEEQRKKLQIATQNLQNDRNLRSKEVGLAKARGEDIEPMRNEVNTISAELEKTKHKLEHILGEIETISLTLPNIPHDSVPIGQDETENVELKRWGDITRFDFTPKSHDELGEALGELDFDLASKITGSRFVVMKNNLARLHRALIHFMLDVHTREHHYQEIYVPYIVNAQSAQATGQLPKLEQDLFKLTGEQNYYLTSTAEIPVTNMVRDTILR